MEQLKVIGTEDGVLVLATDAGDRYTLAVDDVLRAELRRAKQDRVSEPRGARANPRDIQAHIRAGLTAQEVAELLGIRIEDVQRYEGPVLAEREHIVGVALAIPVLTGADFEPEIQPTFGTAVRSKLAEAGATGERWTSWRESAGWVIKLEFTAGDVDHDARWGFDPRRSSLTPQNADATQLSRQGSLPDGLIPRLRALDAPLPKDESRFDSATFGLRRVADPEAEQIAPEVRQPTTPAVTQAAIKRAPDATLTSPETADLLEALRRRRGQRDPLPVDEPAPGKPRVPLFDELDPEAEGDQATANDEDSTETAPIEHPSEQVARRKGRHSMPSWDEIVFGARTEE